MPKYNRDEYYNGKRPTHRLDDNGNLIPIIYDDPKEASDNEIALPPTQAVVDGVRSGIPKIPRSNRIQSGLTVESTGQLGFREQYERTILMLSDFGIINQNRECIGGGVGAPSYAEVLETLGVERLEKAGEYQELKFHMVPRNNPSVIINAINSGGPFISLNDVVTRAIRENQLPEAIIGWEVMIAEGSKEIGVYDWDDLDRLITHRIRNRKSKRKKIEIGMDIHRYLMLIMEAIYSGRNLDEENHILLEDQAYFNGFVLKATSDNGTFLFESIDLLEKSDCALFRPAVGAPVKIN